MNEQSNVKKVIGVVSGKGGVGKSSVTSMLAVATRRMGYKVAILDADVTGPSIPQAFGIKEKATGTDEMIFPVESKTGITVMSVNALLADTTDPVVWRGPVLSGVIEQFWNNVVWGDIDVMFVDMPPGTGDVALTVFQSLPLDGIVIVTSPQELVSMIVEKAVKMAQMMNVPVIGIVENMSYFVCPDCGSRHRIFGESHLDKIADKYHIGSMAEIPMNTRIAAACDKGTIELFDGDWLDGMVEACLAADNPDKHDGMPQPPEGCTGSCESCSVDGCGSRK
ncbi:MAG: Mrp/NBP35 family ATP-binding protein [Anaerovoracaceae bacterium]|nr:Mrp/NBP35 family ATP-binding protein [Anaerovoracaceae bacterium]